MNDKIIGRNPVMEAIRSGRTIDKIFVKSGKQEGSIIPILKKAKELKIVISEVDKAKLAELAGNENHQGIVAYVSEIEYKTINDVLNYAESRNESPFVIICDKICDDHNLGAIIRTAECVGAHGIIIPKRNSASVNDVVMKASAGAAMYIPIVKVTNIANTIDELKDNGFWITGTDADGESMYSIDFKGKIGIVIGSEGGGISRLVREKCDFIASIPMKGKIGSLNASVAGGIVMYEALRQREK